MSQTYNYNIKRSKFMHFVGKFSRGPWVKNTPKNLEVQGRVLLEHSGHIVKVSVKTIC